MKRLIGRFLVVGLLSGGAMSVAASPSSAAVRNQCMDQANYDSQVQWYEDQWDTSFENLEAWANADHYVNPLTGQEVWEATFPGGATSRVYSSYWYNQRLNSATTTMNDYNAALEGFLDAWSVCP